jgi:glycosyltransferase involved in cell wall biosynthesis
VVTRGFRALLRGRDKARYIVQNPDDRDLLLQENMARPDQVRVIPGAGVDLDRFPVRPEPEPGPEGPTVLTHSRLLWDKGIGDLARAAAILREQNVAIRFLLAGEPDPCNPTSIPESALRAWQDQGLIHWLGRRNDIPDLLAQSHLACLPTFYREGVPLSLIEAAAAGRAIITCDCPGARETVDPGRSGLLVPPRDPQALARALAELAADTERRRAMGRAGRARAENLFAKDRIIDQTLEVYAELLGRKP